MFDLLQSKKSYSVERFSVYTLTRIKVPIRSKKRVFVISYFSHLRATNYFLLSSSSEEYLGLHEITQKVIAYIDLKNL